MAGPLVAVVQDDGTLQWLLREALEEAGYRARVWPTGDGAYPDFRASPPALALLDIRLERPDAGWELLQQLRADPATAGIPVLVTTADGAFLRERAGEARALGAEVLALPFDLDDLLAAVRRLAGPPGAAPGA